MRGQQPACMALFADLSPDEWCAEFQLETAPLTFKQHLNNRLWVVLDRTTFPPDLAKQVRSCFVVVQSATQVRDCSDRMFLQCVSVKSVIWLQPYLMGSWNDVDSAPEITCMMCKLKLLLALLMQSNINCCCTSPHTIAGMWAMHHAPSFTINILRELSAVACHTASMSEPAKPISNKRRPVTCHHG